LAWIDTSTGELFTQKSTLAARTLTEDLARIAPAEIVLSEDLAGPDNALHPIRQAIDDLDATPKLSFPIKRAAQEELADSLEDDAEVESGFSAIPLLADYISETLLEHQPDLTHPLRVRPANTMRIDRVSLKALEIRQNNDGGRSGTLISVLDRTVTSAGMRLLSDRIVAPSKSIQEIESRHALVAIFQKMPFLRDEIISRLRQLDDEVRLLQKMSIGRPTAEDLLQMAKAIRVQTDIKAVVDAAIKDVKLKGSDLQDLQVLKALNADLKIHDDLADKIEAAIDAAALDTQKMRDAASASGAQAQPESVDETEEEDGLDVWNIPIEVVLGKAKKSSKKKQAEEEESAPLPVVTKSGKPPTVLVTWGKQDQPVLQAE
jgi:DNA mismatch repair ATPase MutS